MYNKNIKKGNNFLHILVLLIFLFVGFGFPVTSIHCDKSKNICKIGRPFFLIPNIHIFRKYKQLNSIEFNKIEKSEEWHGDKQHKLGYNIGFYLKNSNKKVFLNNEKGDVHIIAYSIFKKPAITFCEEFNHFIQDENLKNYSKIFFPEWCFELLVVLVLTLLFRLNYVIRNGKLGDGVFTIIFSSVIFSIPVVLITLLISFFI